MTARMIADQTRLQQKITSPSSGHAASNRGVGGAGLRFRRADR
jgi:hypothetical protein